MAVAKTYVPSANGTLTLPFLSGYALELNPGELVWRHMKCTGVARSPLRRDEMEAQFGAIERIPQLVGPFCPGPAVEPITAL